MNTADQIFKITLEFHRAVRHRFAKTGRTPWQINPLQLFALFAIQEQEGITMSELAQALKITSPSATSFANRLVKYGWIERKADPKNRKIVRLFMVQAGKKVLENHVRDKNNFMTEILNLLPDKDQKELLRILKTLLQNLSND